MPPSSPFAISSATRPCSHRSRVGSDGPDLVRKWPARGPGSASRSPPVRYLGEEAGKESTSVVLIGLEAPDAVAAAASAFMPPGGQG